MLKAVESVIDRVGRAAAWLALAIVLLMATNVVLRYLFSYGSVWSQELEWHLLVPLVLFAIAWTMQKGEHVRVDVAYARFPPKVKEGVNLLTAVLCFVISVLVVYLSIKYVEQAYVIDEKSSDPGGLTHRWVLKAFIPLGFALLALQGLVDIARSVLRLRGDLK